MKFELLDGLNVDLVAERAVPLSKVVEAFERHPELEDADAVVGLRESSFLEMFEADPAAVIEAAERAFKAHVQENYRVWIERASDGTWSAYSEDFTLYARGLSLGEAWRRARERDPAVAVKREYVGPWRPLP